MFAFLLTIIPLRMFIGQKQANVRNVVKIVCAIALRFVLQNDWSPIRAIHISYAHYYYISMRAKPLPCKSGIRHLTTQARPNPCLFPCHLSVRLLNSILLDCLQYLLDKLQKVQNATAGLCVKLRHLTTSILFFKLCIDYQ